MKELFKAKSLWMLVALLCLVFILNIFSPPSHDGLSYAFLGQSTPYSGSVPRVASLMDIFAQQYGDYFRLGGNGRVLVHGIVACFAGFKLYALFDFVNTVVFLLLVIGVLREGKVSWKNSKSLLFGFAFVWWFIWYANTCSMNAAFAVNYLWMACLTCYMMSLWQKLNRWWQVPFFFLYGWSQECFVLPMIATCAAQAMLTVAFTRKVTVHFRKLVAWFCMCGGAALLCLGPASLGRASKYFDKSLLEASLEFLRLNFNFVLLVFPAILLLAVLFIVIKKRHTFIRTPHLLSPWWLYLFFSYGLYCAINENATRLILPMLLGAIICVIQERDLIYKAFPALVRVKPLFVGGVSLWMAVAAAHQVVYGLELKRALRGYVADEQGITTHTLYASPLWYYSTQQTMYYTLWHWTLFRLEFEKPCAPSVFPKSLYETIYLNPPAFFERASELGTSGLFVLPQAPRALVKRGTATFTAQQHETFMRHLTALSPPKTSWQRFIPGRMEAIFFPEHEHLVLTRNPFTFVAKDGETYTLFACSGMELDILSLPPEPAGASPTR